MAEKKIKGKVPAAVKEFYDTVPPNRDPRMTGAKYRKYLRGLKKVTDASVATNIANRLKSVGKRNKLSPGMKKIMVDKTDKILKSGKSLTGGDDFLQRRITLGGVGSQAAKAAKATKVGKIAAGVAAAALATKAGLEKLYEKRTGKKPFTKREKKRTLVDKKMGGGMMMRRPMMASEGRLTNRDVQAAKDALKIKKAKPGDRGYKMIQRSLDTIKSDKKMDKKMGGGLTEATRRLRAQGLKTGGSACRGMGAAIRGGDFKGVK